MKTGNNCTRFIDLTGLVFGKLKVIERVNNNKHNQIVWKCQCECGKIVFALAYMLRQKLIVSCGCLKTERIIKLNFKDMTGKRFGKLVVIKRAKNRGDVVMWECLCDCGNVINIAGESLRKEITKSCGCLQESFIASELKLYYIKNYNAITEYKIFRNPKTNYFLPYDIYIPDKIFIEINGYQHYYSSDFFHKTLEDFSHRKELDKLKREYAEENGIFIEIDLRKIKTVESAITLIENKISEEMLRVNSKRIDK